MHGAQQRGKLGNEIGVRSTALGPSQPDEVVFQLIGARETVDQQMIREQAICLRGTAASSNVDTLFIDLRHEQAVALFPLRAFSSRNP